MPVEWSRLSGEQTEQVLGVLLLREHPTASRVRPAQGDHGLDVVVPGSEGWTVYQVKSFTSAMGSPQKRQVRKSWERFLEYVSTSGQSIAGWYLIRPENATLPERQFLSELTKDASWPCEPLGLDHCDSLAAKYPDVIDYYLHDGRDRVEAQVRSYLAALGAVPPNGDPAFDAATSVEQLTAIHETLNRVDPHYRYDFSVEARPPGVPVDSRDWPRIEQNEPFLVFVSALVSEERAVVFRVFARYVEAPQERPLTIRFRATVREGSPDAEAWQDFMHYGRSTGRLAVQQVSMDLPGGLGRDEGDAIVRVGPSIRGERLELDLEILPEDGDAPIATIRLTGPPLSLAPTGEGGSFEVTDVTNCLTFINLIDLATARNQMTLSWRSTEGQLVRDALAIANIMAAFHRPHRYRVRLADGPQVVGVNPIDEEPDMDAEVFRTILSDLSVIQRHTPQRTKVPNVETINRQSILWGNAAALLQGAELTKEWEGRMAVQGSFAVDANELESQVVTDFDLTQPLSIPFGRDTIFLGQVRTLTGPVKIEEVHAADNGPVTVVFTPHPGPLGILTRRVMS